MASSAKVGLNAGRVLVEEAVKVGDGLVHWCPVDCREG